MQMKVGRGVGEQVSRRQVEAVAGSSGTYLTLHRSSHHTSLQSTPDFFAKVASLLGGRSPARGLLLLLGAPPSGCSSSWVLLFLGAPGQDLHVRSMCAADALDNQLGMSAGMPRVVQCSRSMDPSGGRNNPQGETTPKK
jgi:hypothetical protein